MKKRTASNFFAPGDFINCHDKLTAGEAAVALNKVGYEWDFVYERDGVKGIWIEILARPED